MVSANPDVSILMGTMNRLELLKKSIASIAPTIGESFSHEVIVVDGGSLDGSREWLRTQPWVHLICEDRPRGAVAAFNRGWVECSGRYIAWMNDDAEYREMALEIGLQTLENDKNNEIGQVAFKFGDDFTKRWREYHGKLYANYGIARWEDLARVADRQGGPDCFWNPCYQTYSADVEQSIWMWKLGLRVELAPWGWVYDHEAQDALRASHNLHADSSILCNRWPKGSV
jgi:glycosyltransferase involved in cell wall biosynthesis